MKKGITTLYSCYGNMLLTAQLFFYAWYKYTSPLIHKYLHMCVMLELIQLFQFLIIIILQELRKVAFILLHN